MRNDPFELLGLPTRFNLTNEEIEERYRALAKALHPDRFTRTSASERRLSLQRAVAVNEAYRALRAEATRAEALLARHGAQVNERESGMPGEFLMEMMELREELASARMKRDVARVHALAKAAQQRRTRIVEELGVAFDSQVPPDVTRAKVALAELKYFDRFLEEVGVLEEELDVLISAPPLS